MKATPPILGSKEEKPKFIPIYYRDEFFIELEKIEKCIALEEVFLIAEIPEEID